MSKRKNSNLWAGLGIGAAILGAASTAGALVVAHEKAKQHNTTTMKYIKGKVSNVIPKKKETCVICGNEPCICDFDDFLTDDEDAIDFSNSPDLFEIENLVEEAPMSVEEERDMWKQRYEELAAALSAAANADEE